MKLDRGKVKRRRINTSGKWREEEGKGQKRDKIVRKCGSK